MGEKQPPYPHRSEVNKNLPIREQDPNAYTTLGKDEPAEPIIDEEEQ